MAIDTANERGSTIGILPFPDGAISARDRVHVCDEYIGLVPIDEPIPEEAIPGSKPSRYFVQPIPDWYDERTRIGDRIIKEQIAAAKAREQRDKQVIAYRREQQDDNFRMMIAEERIDEELEKEARISAILQGEKVAKRNLGIKKQRLMNLEKAKLVQDKEAQRQEVINQQRLKNLKKARAAKKRKAKKKRKK